MLHPSQKSLDAGDAKTNILHGRHYCVFVWSLEAAAKKPSGKPWDRDGEAPDLIYEVQWRQSNI